MARSEPSLANADSMVSLNAGRYSPSGSMSGQPSNGDDMRQLRAIIAGLRDELRYQKLVAKEQGKALKEHSKENDALLIAQL